ncbi:amidohydrolase family protein [Alteromonas sp. 1_MG-2023]|uniref:amidohydrolase family protein n=1 Tax=Alteromonas sp. 1_MG-2023 TaxID=3062669 RepID=UPI0026E24279|nr:amidohydrolase family protein [Alteromonas sp. 1_MG-2023]MDO6565915.1 amidohydrolase family protein [Alteromonas sp. 1_MG-2023]
MTKIVTQLGAVLLLFTALLGCSKTNTQTDIGEENNNTKIVTYQVVFRESIAGSYIKTAVADNTYSYTYHYTDRGRGPKIQEVITYDNDYYITRQRVNGVNYLKLPFEDYFEIKDGKATYFNTLGTGTTDYTDPQFYFRFDGSPAVYEVLGNLFLKNNGKPVQVFDGGEFSLIEKKPVTLENGERLTLLVIKGIDMTPLYLWMQGDSMIARIAGNRHIIREDFVASRLEIKALQDSEEEHYLSSLAKNLSNKIDEIKIENVSVFLPSGKLASHQDVFIVGDKISQITDTQRSSLDDITIIDGTGKTLLPGLFDMHTHNSKARGLLHIAGGVTSVRDLANNKQLKSLGRQFDENQIIGPRIVIYAGIIDGPGPLANKRNSVSTLEQALAEIDDYHALGYDQIKLYSAIKTDWVEPLINRAKGYGMRVSGHIPAFMSTQKAIELGYNEVQHINMVFLNFLSTSIDTRTPLRHTMPARHGYKLDLNDKKYIDFVDLLIEKDVLIDPTVALFENILTSKKGLPSPTYEKIVHRLPIVSQRAYFTGGFPTTAETAPLYEKSFQKMLDVVYDLHKKGVALGAGTDGLPGFLLHRELELYGVAGISNEDVLKMATIRAAEITKQADKLGSIEVGKNADVILIDGDPLENLSDIRNVELTFKGGYYYDVKALYAALGIKHFK